MKIGRNPRQEEPPTENLQESYNILGTRHSLEKHRKIQRAFEIGRIDRIKETLLELKMEMPDENLLEVLIRFTAKTNARKKLKYIKEYGESPANLLEVE